MGQGTGSRAKEIFDLQKNAMPFPPPNTLVQTMVAGERILKKLGTMAENAGLLEMTMQVMKNPGVSPRGTVSDRKRWILSLPLMSGMKLPTLLLEADEMQNFTQLNQEVKKHITSALRQKNLLEAMVTRYGKELVNEYCEHLFDLLLSWAHVEDSFPKIERQKSHSAGVLKKIPPPKK